MAHMNHCGKVCAECTDNCITDQSIPCSPDCVNLGEDGRPKDECIAECAEFCDAMNGDYQFDIFRFQAKLDKDYNEYREGQLALDKSILFNYSQKNAIVGELQYLFNNQIDSVVDTEFDEYEVELLSPSNLTQFLDCEDNLYDVLQEYIYQKIDTVTLGLEAMEEYVGKWLDRNSVKTKQD